MNVLVDDHLLREILLEREPAWLRRRRRSGTLTTTGSWYYRLCHAMQAPDVRHALSGPVARLEPGLQMGVGERVAALPPWIELHSFREVAWPASGLAVVHGLNLLAAEALAVAVVTRSAIATSEGNFPPRLLAAAEEHGVRIIAASD